MNFQYSNAKGNSKREPKRWPCWAGGEEQPQRAETRWLMDSVKNSQRYTYWSFLNGWSIVLNMQRWLAQGSHFSIVKTQNCWYLVLYIPICYPRCYQWHNIYRVPSLDRDWSKQVFDDRKFCKFLAARYPGVRHCSVPKFWSYFLKENESNFFWVLWYFRNTLIVHPGNDSFQHIPTEGWTFSLILIL